MDNLQMIGVSDAAKMLCIAPKTVRNLVKAGELPAYVIGNKWLFKTDDLLAYIENSKVQTKGEKDND